MESIKLSERVSGDDEVPEFDVPLNLTTINDDCRELIFEHLGLQDLLNIAETSKRLHSAACAVFKRKYGRAKIDFHHVGYGSQSLSRFELQRKSDIRIDKQLTAYKLLRTFGHLISDLFIHFYTMFKIYYDSVNIQSYLVKYCSKSLTHFTIIGGVTKLFFVTAEPFIKVRFLYIESFCFQERLDFSHLFPNLECLTLGRNNYESGSFIRTNFSGIKKLYFTNIPKYSEGVLTANDIQDMLRLNPQIEHLDLQYCIDLEILPFLQENCTNFQSLRLFCVSLNRYSPSQHCHFDNVVNFTFFTYFGIRSDLFPFSFTNLKHLTYETETDLQRHGILDIIAKNHHLVSIDIKNGIDHDNLGKLFELENVLSNIQSLKIQINFNEIPADKILRFLENNQSLREFSFIASRTECFDSLYYLLYIIENPKKLAMYRNEDVNFTITRKSDRIPMKYAFRTITIIETQDYYTEKFKKLENVRVLKNK